MAVVRRAKSAKAAQEVAAVPPRVNGSPVPAAVPTPRAVVHTDPLNELIVIAACIVDWETGKKTTPLYAPDFFQVEQHRTIWEGLRTMHSRGLGWDPETLRQVSGGKADVDYLLGVIEARPEVPPNLAHHLEVLGWDRARAAVARGPLSALLKVIDDPRAAPDRVRALAEEVAAELTAGAKSSAGPVWSDLAAEYATLGAEREWFATGIIEGAPIGLFIGPEKTGKSWALLDLAIATITGGKWLGRFAVTKPGPALYLDAEYGPKEFVRRAARLARGAGHDPRAVFPGLRHVHAGNMYLSPTDPAFSRVLSSVRSEPPRLIVVDPLRNLLSGSENDAETVLAALRCAAMLRDAAGCPVIVAHHLNKAGLMSGSRALLGRADIVFEGSDEEEPWYGAKGRNVRRHDAGKASRFTILVDHDNDDDEPTASTTVSSRFEGELAAKTGVSKSAVRVLDALKHGPISATGLKRHRIRGMNSATIRRALDELKLAGRVQCRDGKWTLVPGEFFDLLRTAADDDKETLN